MTPAWTCKDVFERLDDYLDRRLEPEELTLLLDHLAVCRDCAVETRFEQDQLAELKAKLRRVDVPESLKSGILQAIRQADEK